mmetsp:Transcript_8849/g.14723  ORF Transcript_8849/g.14723 Transcript_8849/m.14723 type:complete len:217 (-) Transcript_8849:140-790(-)|eukprot:CAMPEP_0119012992 /NCGR_PEP_ID=MMETSP1176-20130426/7737_1 /TAXON_ID=265551 /ORGANISM="Synedropsis recta cf, Strain CCMP1620" /LENGTH=216 /DNA_ID=CAMNT_0006966037 /DNA_START=82 /DNA_END=732 /DNA_ORIENTATION=-
MASKKSNKKQKTESNGNGKRKEDEIVGDGYESLSLEDIQHRVNQLCHRIPKVPPTGLDPDDEDSILDWASELQTVVEEFNLLVCCISPATYKWGSERSGAADQHLGVLSAELGSCQEQISSTVTPRLTNILAPAVDLVVDKIVVTMEGEIETKQNVYTSKQIDPEFAILCRRILSRNAKLIRQVCLANFHKMHRCIGDYLQAQMKDSQHDSRGFSY